MILYLIKVNLTLALLCLLFQVVMHRDTFFGVRRLMLWGIYLTAFLLPLWNVQGWLATGASTHDMAEAYATFVLPTLDVTATNIATLGIRPSEPGCGMWFVGCLALWVAVYLVPVIWLSLRLLTQVAYLIYLRCTCKRFKVKSERVKSEKYEWPSSTVGNSHFSLGGEADIFHFSFFLYPRPCSPFSFGPWIFLHPDGMDEQTLREVLIHEQAHVRQWHTLDILFAEVVCILFWWNPAAWVMRREVRMNLEFLADKAVADYLQVKSERVKSEKYELPSSTVGNPYFSLGGEADIFHFSLKAYQYRLLGFATQTNVATIANNFNVLPLKRRITMMNLRRTRRTGMVKYAFFVLAAAALLLVSNVDALARTLKEKVKTNLVITDETHADETQIEAKADTCLTTPFDPETLFIVDGKQMSLDEFKSLPKILRPDNIESATMIGPESAIQIYGNKGTKGAVIIETKKSAPDNKIHDTAEVLPEYKGGMEALFRHLMTTVKYPAVAQEWGVQGRVMVGFIVETDGTLSEVKATQVTDAKTGKALPEMTVTAKTSDSDEQTRERAEHEAEGVRALKAEAERAVASLPERWTPGRQGGKPVRVRFNLPVMFRLQ